jgi:hypothetical protein
LQLTASEVSQDLSPIGGFLLVRLIMINS